MSVHQVPWVPAPEVVLDLNVPVADRYRNMPQPVLERGRRLLEAVLAEFPPHVRRLAPLVRLRTRSRFHAEVTVLAQLIRADWQDLLMANLAYDLVMASIGCSTIALATPDGPVVARNMDWWPEDILARCSCLIRSERDGRTAFVNAGWPGAVGVVTGMSGRGFAVVLNAVASSEGFNRTGYPVLLFLRRVLEDADGFESARQMLTQQKLTTSALLTLVGTDNEERVVIERTPTRCAERRPRDNEALIATNDFRLLFRPQTSEISEIYRTTCSRYDYLVRHFGSHAGDNSLSNEELLYVLTDPAVRQSMTAQHILLRPRCGDVSVYVPRDLLSDDEFGEAGDHR